MNAAMLLRMTYLSDGYRVQGYMYVPAGGPWLRGEDIRRYAEKFYGTDGLPVTELACGRRIPAGSGGRADAPEKLPVLVYCRGGSGGFGRVRTHWMEQFASRGHLVFAPCYRGNEGGEGRDEFGGAEQEDVESAIRFLASLPFTDPERMTVMGFSRGAINAARAAVTAGVNGLVLWSGVSDLAETYRERPDLRRTLKRMVGGTPERLPEEYERRSPVRFADRIPCPVLVIHGTEDRLVPYSHGAGIVARVRGLGRQAEELRYEGEGHLFSSAVHEEAVVGMLDWIERLAPREANS